MANIASQMQPQPIAPRDPNEFAGLKNQWMDFLGRPETQAGLLQFAASVIQPVGRGQSVLGNIGMAMADAGGAVGRLQETQRGIDQQVVDNTRQQQTVDIAADRNKIEREQLAQAAASDAATLAFSREKLGRELTLEERKLNEYLIPMAAKYGTGGGNATSLRDKLVIELYKSAFRAQEDADLTGDEFDLNSYTSQGMAVINSIAPEGGTAQGLPPTPEGSGGGGADAPAPSGEIPQIKTADEYNALPPGAKYRDPEGNVRQKPTAVEMP